VPRAVALPSVCAVTGRFYREVHSPASISLRAGLDCSCMVCVCEHAHMLFVSGCQYVCVCMLGYTCVCVRCAQLFITYSRLLYAVVVDAVLVVAMCAFM